MPRIKKPVLSEDLQYLRRHKLIEADQPKAAEAIQQTFEQMGGVQRMLLWADRQPAAFYKLYARQTIPTIAPVLPQPEAEQQTVFPEWITARRLLYQESISDSVSRDILDKGSDDVGGDN